MSIITAETIELIASAARTATVTTTVQTNRFNYGGLLLAVEVTAITASPLVTPSIRFIDSVAGVTNNIWTAAAAIGAVGSFLYMFVPGASGTPSGDLVELLGMNIPRSWDLTLVHGDTDSITYQVTATYL